MSQVTTGPYQRNRCRDAHSIHLTFFKDPTDAGLHARDPKSFRPIRPAGRDRPPVSYDSCAQGARWAAGSAQWTESAARNRWLGIRCRDGGKKRQRVRLDLPSGLLQSGSDADRGSIPPRIFVTCPPRDTMAEPIRARQAKGVVTAVFHPLRRDGSRGRTSTKSPQLCVRSGFLWCRLLIKERCRKSSWDV